LAFILVLVFIFNFTEINLKPFSSENLAEKNDTYLKNQKKLDSLENELVKIDKKTVIIENIIQTFLSTDPVAAPGIPEKADNAFLSKRHVHEYLSSIDSIQQKQIYLNPVPQEYKPYIWPVNGIVTNRFREKHNGIDIISKLNSLVTSTAKGVVIEAGWHKDLGKIVKINHGGYFHTMYAHLNRTYVNIGDHVSRGRPIGTLGNTGNSTGPHLHYEIHYQNTPINPDIFIGK
jgi:murein DD-endopeptidase MepM/ murein hydrolase activator NlpD